MVVSPLLITLTSHRWNLPLVAHLGEQGRSPFNALVRDLAVSRDSLSRSLRALTIPGWLRREDTLYRLTAQGLILSPPCADLIETVRRAALESVLLRKWSLPIAAALRHWTLRFSELKAMLGDITPRALTLALKDMQAAGLVHREVIGGFPPSTSYRLTPMGEEFLPALSDLSAVT